MPILVHLVNVIMFVAITAINGKCAVRSHSRVMVFDAINKGKNWLGRMVTISAKHGKTKNRLDSWFRRASRPAYNQGRANILNILG
jgi:hypothetical protein